MSITGNSGAADLPAAEPAEGDAAHTDLVTRLVAEAYSEFTRAVRQPATLPEAPAAPSLPSLSPADAPSAVPPVHPSSQPAAPKLTPSEQTPTGAHAPESGDTYAFGEPRCNSDYRPQNNKPDTRTANSNSVLGFAQAESLATPDF